MRQLSMVCAAALAGVASSAVAATTPADPTPKIAPAPAWVEPLTIPAADPALKDRSVQMVLLASQTRFRSDGEDTFLEMVSIPQTSSGLQEVGTVALPWNVDRTDLILHRVVIERAGQTIDLLKPADLLVLRRENNLERATLDGVRTVVVPTKGLQIGDRLIIDLSYTTKPSTIAARPDDVMTMAAPEIISRLQRRFLVPDGLMLNLRRSDGLPALAKRAIPGFTEYRTVSRGKKDIDWPTGTPAHFKVSEIQFSGWQHWSDIAARLSPLYDTARTLPAGSPLLAEADKIAATTSDPGKRMLAALRLAQEQVRYVALLLGEGAYRPADAVDTWDRRFGDCKGKTALLLALLDRLKIPAEPMLVNSSGGDILGTRLPSLASFDHVIARARLNGKSYYLDATDYGQRTLDELARSNLQFGLPLVPGADLIKLPRTAPQLPIYESAIVWDGRGGFDHKVPFVVTLTFRGESAAAMRTKRDADGKTEEYITKLKEMVPSIRNDDLMLVSDEPEQPDGSYVARFKGAIATDWSPISGMKGFRFQFGQSTVKWDADLGRSTGDHKDLPMMLGWPFYQQTTETLLLPGGGRGFKVDATPIDSSIMGFHVNRSVALEGDKVVSRSEFRHISPEVTAEQVRAGLTEREKINKTYAYVIAPGKVRPVEEGSAGK